MPCPCHAIKGRAMFGGYAPVVQLTLSRRSGHRSNASPLGFTMGHHGRPEARCSVPLKSPGRTETTCDLLWSHPAAERAY